MRFTITCTWHGSQILRYHAPSPVRRVRPKRKGLTANVHRPYEFTYADLPEQGHSRFRGGVCMGDIYPLAGLDLELAYGGNVRR